MATFPPNFVVFCEGDKEDYCGGLEGYLIDPDSNLSWLIGGFKLQLLQGNYYIKADNNIVIVSLFYIGMVHAAHLCMVVTHAMHVYLTGLAADHSLPYFAVVQMPLELNSTEDHPLSLGRYRL